MRSASDRPRSPGVVYGVAFLVLMVLVGTVALTSRQAPPPTIAEFAPQAVEQIQQSDPGQASSSGRGQGTGAGTGGGGAPVEVPEELERPLDVPRVRRC